MEISENMGMRNQIQDKKAETDTANGCLRPLTGNRDKN